MTYFPISWPFVDDGISVYTPMINISPQQTVLMARWILKTSLSCRFTKPCLDSEGMMVNISLFVRGPSDYPLARSLANNMS